MSSVTSPRLFILLINFCSASDAEFFICLQGLSAVRTSGCRCRNGDFFAAVGAEPRVRRKLLSAVSTELNTLCRSLRRRILLNRRTIRCLRSRLRLILRRSLLRHCPGILSRLNHRRLRSGLSCSVVQKLLHVNIRRLRVCSENIIGVQGQILSVLLIPCSHKLYDGISDIYRRAVLIRHKMNCARAAVHIVLHRKIQSEAD